MSIVEEKIWNYIDGTCKIEEYHAVSALIEQDETYRRKYLELLSLTQEFSGMELDEPPMAFTYNVMETIRTEEAKKPLKVTVNMGIIKGIAAFFAFTIVALLIFIIANTNFTAAVAIPQISNFTMPDISKYFSAPVIQGFLFCDVILGLFFLDTYRRKRSFSKSA